MRLAFLTIGILSLALGFLGIFLPLLPTTPFILLSAYCFSKSSPRLYQWLTSNKTFGPIILEWQQHRTLPRKIKKRAVYLIIATFAVTIIFFTNKIYLQFLLLLLASILVTYIVRIPSRDVTAVARTEEN